MRGFGAGSIAPHVDKIDWLFLTNADFVSVSLNKGIWLWVQTAYT